MSKTAIIIPARWGSTRFPGKPLHIIAGKPLIQHVWERCQLVRSAEVVVISTDDMRIAETAFDFGAEVSLTSPRLASGTDRVASVAAKMVGYSLFINVQGDEPLIEPKLISALIQRLKQNSQLQMVTAATLIHKDAVNDPNRVKVVLDRNERALYFSRAPIPYDRSGQGLPRPLLHLGIYGYRRAFLMEYVRWRPTPLEKAECLEQLRALEHGASIGVVVTKQGSPGVDVPEDARYVEKLLRKQTRRVKL